MLHIGSLGEELLRVLGRSAASAETRLKSVVDGAVTKHGLGKRATAEIREAIDDDPALMVELLDQMRFTEAVIQRFTERRLAELRAAGEHVPAGQADPDAQTGRARPANKPRPLSARAAEVMGCSVLDRICRSSRPATLSRRK